MATVLLVAMLLFAGQAYLVGYAIVDLQHTNERVSRLSDATSTIRYVDEVLTMSARMAVYTGDPAWADRYASFVPVLDRVLADAVRLYPGARTELDQTSAANQRLIAMETRALELAAEGRLGQARRSVFSAAYARDKAVYADGLERLVRDSEAYNATARAELRTRIIVAGCVTALMSVFMLLALVDVFWRLHRRGEMEETLSRVSRTILTCPREEVDDTIATALGSVASLTGFDLCWLRRHARAEAQGLEAEWRAPGTPPLDPQLEPAGVWDRLADVTGVVRLSVQGTTGGSPETESLLRAGARTVAVQRVCDDGGPDYRLALARVRGGLLRPSADPASLQYVADGLVMAIERRKLERELARMAVTDPLTGLVNRRRFAEVVRMEIERCRRSQRPAAIFMIDVDDFKRVNDTFGHAEGDAVLGRLAVVARESLRSVDVVGRVGGEEFAAVLPGCGTDDALAAAERLRVDIARKTAPQSPGGATITVSIGVTLLLGTDDDADDALRRADAALYAAKRGGRDRVKFAA